MLVVRVTPEHSPSDYRWACNVETNKIGTVIKVHTSPHYCEAIIFDKEGDAKATAWWINNYAGTATYVERHLTIIDQVDRMSTL